MEELGGLLGLNGDPAMTIIVLFIAFVLAVGLLWLVYKLIARPRFSSRQRAKQARLAITDAATVDQRRRLVLLRRDDVEHLILIGGPTDIVIETDIRKNAPRQPLPTPDREVLASATDSPQVAQSRHAERRTEPSVSTGHPQRSAAGRPELEMPSNQAKESAKPEVEVRRTPPVERVEPRLGAVDPNPKRSVVAEMDALLDEITPKR